MIKFIFRVFVVMLLYTEAVQGKGSELFEIANQTDKKFEVVANPMKNSFEVKTELNCSYMFLIEDGAKKVVFSEYGRGNQEFFPLLDKGNYVIKVISSQKSLIQRIRVEN